MPTNSQRLRTEIAHVLFVDIVGYSLLSMEEQPALIQELNEIVGQTPEFLRAITDGEIFSLGTGDGMALVFLRDTVAPVQCACEIASALRSRSHLPLRMGINSGPITRVRDINGNNNVSGDGINMARRVMDCGDADHILISRTTAEILSQFKEWAPHVHAIGEHEVKHGLKIHLFNLYLRCDDHAIGNPASPLSAKINENIQTEDHSIGNPASSLPAKVNDSLQTPGTDDRGGGPVPLPSPKYILRPVDREFSAALARRDSIVLVKGARQMGKTSLLARGLSQARQAGMEVVLTDFQTLNHTHLHSADTLFMALAVSLADQLELEVKPHKVWDPELGASPNMEWFLRRHVLKGRTKPLVWGLDELDRLFSCPYGSEVFGLFRSWHNRRTLDPSGPWSQLTLAIAYATEAHLFITDLNQSPFNVGTRLKVEDFNMEQVQDLNVRYGRPLRDHHELHRYYALLNGHPFLTRQGLDELVTHGINVDGLEAQADREEGPFGDHLRRLVHFLTRDAELTEVVRLLLRGDATLKPEVFYRLRSAGLIVGESERDARIRCRLYTTYLQRHLV